MLESTGNLYYYKLSLDTCRGKKGGVNGLDDDGLDPYDVESSYPGLNPVLIRHMWLHFHWQYDSLQHKSPGLQD